VWTYSGVRPLYDDGASEAKAATRDYVFDVDEKPGLAPVLSIFGGKITTYRRLAEAVLDRLSGFLPAAKAKVGWTGREALPGGDFAVTGSADLYHRLRREFPFLTEEQAARFTRSYGTRAFRFLAGIGRSEDLGRDFGAGLTEAEVRYLMAAEWAVSAEDVLWRRSKLGLRLSAEQAAALDAFMASAVAPATLAKVGGAS
jgi:glycerol-3-phosphate dehydrogenase